MTKLLIVDDSTFARRSLRRVLEAAGYEVVEADSGEAALAAYPVERPSLVLLDLMMPGMSGLEVLAELREMGAEVIIVTADVQRPIRAKTAQQGTRGFIGKPFSEQELLDVIGGALHENRSPQA